MPKTLKTAPEIERYILNDLRTCSACSCITAVTVAQTEGRNSNWEVSNISALGGKVPVVCADMCKTSVERLRATYDLVVEIEPEEL